jgi:ATP-dependent Lhr-like helicase
MKTQKNVFGLLEKDLRKIVGSRFKSPTPIQEKVIPAILDGKDVLTISETGSGKTEAVMLPIFDLWLRDKPNPISILYITPLRSLNRDLVKRILWWSNQLEFEVSVRHGDTSAYERKMQAENPPDMLIVTPETLQAILTGKTMREHLKNIKFIVIDEVHEIVTSKRGVQLALGLERLKELIKSGGSEEPRIMGVSATVGSPQEVVNFLTSRRRKRPLEIIDTSKSERREIFVESPVSGPEDRAAASRLYVGPETAARVRRIIELIKQKKSTLTFTNTREFAEILSSRIKTLDASLPVETHHSSLSRDVRINTEKEFKEGNIRALVCTSSLELGIDVGLIDFMIQYQSPRQVAKFLQRLGRAGHSLEKVSSGVIISSDEDDCFESAVIAKHSLEGRIEPTQIYKKSLDVLAHQIIGMAMDEYKVSLDRIYGIVTRAYPFESLSKEEFLGVCKILEKLRFIWFDDGGVRMRKAAWEYYFSNLSTIPSIKNYQIFDIVSNKPVGTLDAEFISLNGSPGTSFIVKGQCWRILEVREQNNRVYVEPQRGLQAAIPAWEGELIPVPMAISQGVAKLRREIAEMISAGKKQPEIIEHVTHEYPIDKEASRKMCNLMKRQVQWGPVPDEHRLLVEHHVAEGETWVIFHSPFGSLVNETIGRVLTSLLLVKYSAVGLKTDPYRIVIRLPSGLVPVWQEIIETFKQLKPEEIPGIMKSTLPGTELFRWRFLHVAKRFGIIARDADYGKGYLKKIVEVYAGTAPHHEAMNEILQEKLDIPGAVKVMKAIRSGAVKLDVRQGLSPIGEAGIKYNYEVVATGRPEQEIFNIFKERLMNTRVGLVCTQCGKWAIMHQVSDLPDGLKCPICEASAIAVVPEQHILDAQKIIKKYKGGRELTRLENTWLDKTMNTASLVMGSGREAVIVLAGRGIGPRTAGRLLSKQAHGDELLQEILKAERQYARTKQFWRD